MEGFSSQRLKSAEAQKEGQPFVKVRVALQAEIYF